ncbi:hypothetical protein MRX96_059175 [Rhipicephalus microplus]
MVSKPKRWDEELRGLNNEDPRLAWPTQSCSESSRGRNRGALYKRTLVVSAAWPWKGARAALARQRQQRRLACAHQRRRRVRLPRRERRQQRASHGGGVMGGAGRSFGRGRPSPHRNRCCLQPSRSMPKRRATSTPA